MDLQVGQYLNGLFFTLRSTLCTTFPLERSNSGLIFLRLVGDPISQPGAMPNHWICSLQVLSLLCIPIVSRVAELCKESSDIWRKAISGLQTHFYKLTSESCYILLTWVSFFSHSCKQECNWHQRGHLKIAKYNPIEEMITDNIHALYIHHADLEYIQIHFPVL